ncbi:MAG: DUF2917 domain-containing protein [Burkholderiales bacterium]
MDATRPTALTASTCQAGQRPATPLTLQPGAMLRLRRVTGLHVEVQAGRIWLTHSGGLDDHILGAGQGIALDAARDVLIECDGTASARLRWWSRRQRWWASTAAPPPGNSPSAGPGCIR